MIDTGMRYTNEFLKRMNLEKTEKIAAVSNGDSSVEAELELISRVQKYNDNMAMEKLTTMFRGPIYNAVKASGVLSVMSESTANQEAINLFKDLVRKYDITKKAKPSTFIIGSLTNLLQKVNYNNSGSGVKMSMELRGFNKAKFSAEALLERQLGRKPTYEETYNFMRKEMGNKNQDLSPDVLRRIDHYKTDELSGSRTIGNNNAEGAEALTLSDVVSVSDNIETLYNKRMDDESVARELKAFTNDPNKRKFLMMNFGIGEYENKKARSVNEAAFNSGLTYYEANKLISSFRDHMSSKRGV